MAAISAFTVVVHLVLPIGPVINATLIPPIALLATETGQNPVLYALPVAFTASCAFLLPLDPVPLLTYTRGYYRMLDMLRAGRDPQRALGGGDDGPDAGGGPAVGLL